jgi:hypothetical protein
VQNIDTYGSSLTIIEEHFKFEIFFGVVHAYLNIMGPASRAHNPVTILKIWKKYNIYVSVALLSSLNIFMTTADERERERLFLADSPTVKISIYLRPPRVAPYWLTVLPKSHSAWLEF